MPPSVEEASAVAVKLVVMSECIRPGAQTSFSGDGGSDSNTSHGKEGEDVVETHVGGRKLECPRLLATTLQTLVER